MTSNVDRCGPLTAEDVLAVLLRARAADHDDYRALTGRCLAEDAAAQAADLAEGSRFGAVVRDAAGEPQVALGAIPAPIPGVWTLWLHATDRWPEVWRAALRFVRRTAPAVRAAGVRRVQAFVVGARPEAERFLVACGLDGERIEMGRLAVDGRPVSVLAGFPA